MKQKKILSPWSKQAKAAMIQQGYRLQDLADKMAEVSGKESYTASYVGMVVRGDQYSAVAVSLISDILNIPTPTESTLPR